MNRKAIELGVSKLGEVCIDGSRIKANASRSHTLTAEKVQKQLQHLDDQLNAALEEMKHNDELDELFDEPSGDKLPPDLADVAVRKAKLKEMLQQLEEMDAARRKSGIDPAKNPAQLSENDTDARVLPNKEGGYAPNFTPMAITETTNGFIVGADVLIGNDEHVHTISMFDTLTDEYGESPRAALADSAFATGTNIAEFEERDIELIAPLPEGETPSENPAIRDDVTKPVPQDQLDKLPMSKQTKRFDKSAFIYDEEKDVYHCPAGKELTFRYPETVNQRGQRVERRTYQCGECADCCLVELCRTNPQGKGGRRISRNQYEAHLQRHREKMNREETKERYKPRLHYGETQFAFIKEWLGLRQFQLRGIDKVRQEWLWSCTAFNLKKLMNLWRTLCASGEHNPA
jgi:hypothetical protein